MLYARLKEFKKAVITVLTVMMALVLLLSTIELGWVLVKDIVAPPIFLLDIDELLDIFGLFMLVIIGIELLETVMKTYLMESVNHIEVVLGVAIIAIVRKVIILDIKEVPIPTPNGVGVIIIFLLTGNFLLKKSR